MSKELKFIELGVGYEYKTSKNYEYGIRSPFYSIVYEDENGEHQIGFHSFDIGDISKALIKHFGIRSVKEEENE